jgi:hypothetical protein
MTDIAGSPEKPGSYPVNRSPFIRALRLLARMLPGDYLRTFVYLNLVERPRRLLRMALNTFYRIDHIYLVLQEFRRFRGNFSILEFGTSDGYVFTKMLYATRYLRLTDRVVVHTFDTFTGMPATTDERDRSLVADEQWLERQFRGRYEDLKEYCAKRYNNFRIHKGYFHETLTDDLLESLKAQLPVLVWIDCDYYTSARTVLERLAPYLPSGCVIYFDEYDNLNFGSRLTGEARLVHEVNHGLLGDDVELVLDTRLSLDTKRVYRFMRFRAPIRYDASTLDDLHEVQHVHYRTNDSPLP